MCKDLLVVPKSVTNNTQVSKIKQAQLLSLNENELISVYGIKLNNLNIEFYYFLLECRYLISQVKHLDQAIILP